MMKPIQIQAAPERRPGEIMEERIGWHREIALVRFDHPEAPINSLDAKVLQQLDRVIDEIETNPYLDGVVFASLRGSIFLAGADLAALERAWEDEQQMEEYLALGQRVFSRIAALKIPTVAAIHGACIGGGYELALACNHRVASPDAVTRIGLPETRLGLIPAWGGSTRLPALVGMTTALKLITRGQVLPARQALKAGLVDRLAPLERLSEAAVLWIEQHQSSTRNAGGVVRGWWSKLSTKALGGRMRHAIERATGGNYPAVLQAADVMIASAGSTTDESLARERQAVKALAHDERSRNLFRLFTLQEEARRLARNAAQSEPLTESVAVIGAGTMGAGLAQWLSSRGSHVVLRDLNAERLGQGMATIFRLYQKAVKRGVMTTREARAGIDRVSPTLSKRALNAVDWVIEAAPELPGLKQRLFAELDQATGKETLFASNTSALSIRDIASATKRPENVVGIHFFNPVHRMPLVELVVPEGCSVAMKALALIHQIGKIPVLVSDTPGFLVNRVLTPYLLGAVELYDSGMKPEEIDGEMTKFGMPMGPLRLIDEVGLDIALFVADTLGQAWPDLFKVPPNLVRMVEGRLLGKKAGRGFYEYPETKAEARWTAHYYRTQSGVAVEASEIAERLILPMINEAARCLDDGVAASSGEIDLAMVLGTGFPPYRGGPLRFADSMGAATVVKRMEKYGMVPCVLLKRLALESERFYETGN